MDIRKFFGGGGVSKPKPSVTKDTTSKPAQKDTKNNKEKTTKPPTPSKSKDKKKSDHHERITIDSDSDFDDRKNEISRDKNGNVKKRDTSVSREKKEEKVKSENKSRKSEKKDRSPSSGRKLQEKNKSKRTKSVEIESSSSPEVKRSTKKHKQAIDSASSPEVKQSTKKHKHTRLIESSEDEDEEEIKPKLSKKKKNNKAKKGVLFDSDSEDEEPVPKKKPRSRKKKEYHFSSDDEKQTSITEAFSHVKPPSKSSKSDTTPGKKSTPPKKQISAADFFGGSSVHRSEKKTPSLQRKESVKRKAERSPVKINNTIDDFDDDDDFEETLRQIDEKDSHRAKKAKIESEDPKSVSLSSKLAEKVKESYRVIDTPDKSVRPDKPVRPDQSGVKISPAKSTPVKPLPKVSPVTSPVKKSPVKQEKTPDKKSSPETSEKRPNAGYRAYLKRDAPQTLGSKEVPEGGENCLEGLTFVITGVLESFERDEAKTIVERYGGKVTGSISKKTSYLLAGRDSGESKLAKAKSFGTKILDEDGMLDLIRTLPGKKSKYQIAAEKESEATPVRKGSTQTSNRKTSTPSTPASTSRLPSTPKTRTAPGTPSVGTSPQTPGRGVSGGEDLLWVDKYKPTSLKQVIGQQGDKSNARKLLHWLKNWHKNISSGRKPASGFNRFSDDGGGFRCALLSGPPGVGKTTTAHLVCKEAGFSFVELNASDTRSKKSLQQEVAESLNNCSLTGYFGNESSVKAASEGHDHCLVMDEVDGMAGNEDRGGIQELVGLIKNTKIPIICMCNDRNHQKMRTLSNHCFDLRFQRPRLEQIKAAMMTMTYKEGIKIPPPALNDIILASNQDVRQVIHNLSMWSATDKILSHDQLKTDAAKAKKDIKLGPFDVVRKVFTTGEETAHMSLRDKSDLFFHDYSFGPLFVQENYINVQPLEARGDVKKHLSLLSKAAHNIAVGDRVDRMIRNRQKWNLLPLQAMYASVLPGEAMRGYLGGQIQFPSWLGKNSTTNKNDRILQELRSHMMLKVSCDKKGLNMDYLPHLRTSLTSPLANDGSDGVPSVVKHLDEYDLTKEDFDSVLEVSNWPNSKDVMAKVESKTKAAFTRTYNKEVHKTPYATGNQMKKGRRGGGGGGAELEELGEGGEGTSQVIDSEEEKDDITVDSMIKKKTAGAKGKGRGRGAAEAKDKGGKAKGKGTGKGRGRGKGK